MTTSSHALSKEINYNIINQCKYTVYETGKFDNYFAGLIMGLAQGYSDNLSRSGIDNDYASLNVGDFAKEMCNFALWYRKDKNKDTGGKYDVTQFYLDLRKAAYFMTLPPDNDTKKSD